MGYWLLQADEGYRLTREIPGRIREGDFWIVRRYLGQLHVGDKIALWQSGKASGIYGLGSLTAAPFKRANKASTTGIEWRIRVAYSKLLDYPLYASDLRGLKTLSRLLILAQPFGANPFPVTASEWAAIQHLVGKKAVNIFSHYKQAEDQFTNGLLGILDLARHQGGKRNLLRRLLEDVASISLSGDNCRLRVLREIDGTADAEICTKAHCVRIETKIRSGTLRAEQLRSHLRRLQDSPASRKALLLITPDDGRSDYIQRLLAETRTHGFGNSKKANAVVHVEWKAIYRNLEAFAESVAPSPLSTLITQYLEQIYDCIFQQDYAGIIQKISFGKDSEVYEDQYIDQMRANRWRRWNTPRKYEKLDGTGRKLLLYDKTRQAITVEAEIQKVSKTNGDRAFPWSNFFVPKTLKVFNAPIPLDRILAIPGFENFKGGRSANWNVTREQYKLLISES